MAAPVVGTVGSKGALEGPVLPTLTPLGPDQLQISANPAPSTQAMVEAWCANPDFAKQQPALAERMAKKFGGTAAEYLAAFADPEKRVALLGKMVTTSKTKSDGILWSPHGLWVRLAELPDAAVVGDGVDAPSAKGGAGAPKADDGLAPSTTTGDGFVPPTSAGECKQQLDAAEAEYKKLKADLGAKKGDPTLLEAELARVSKRLQRLDALYTQYSLGKPYDPAHPADADAGLTTAVAEDPDLAGTVKVLHEKKDRGEALFHRYGLGIPATTEKAHIFVRLGVPSEDVERFIATGEMTPKMLEIWDAAQHPPKQKGGPEFQAYSDALLFSQLLFSIADRKQKAHVAALKKQIKEAHKANNPALEAKLKDELKTCEKQNYDLYNKTYLPVLNAGNANLAGWKTAVRAEADAAAAKDPAKAIKQYGVLGDQAASESKAFLAAGNKEQSEVAANEAVELHGKQGEVEIKTLPAVRPDLVPGLVKAKKDLALFGDPSSPFFTHAAGKVEQINSKASEAYYKSKGYDETLSPGEESTLAAKKKSAADAAEVQAGKQKGAPLTADEKLRARREAEVTTEGAYRSAVAEGRLDALDPETKKVVVKWRAEKLRSDAHAYGWFHASAKSLDKPDEQLTPAELVLKPKVAVDYSYASALWLGEKGRYERQAKDEAELAADVVPPDLAGINPVEADQAVVLAEHNLKVNEERLKGVTGTALKAMPGYEQKVKADIDMAKLEVTRAKAKADLAKKIQGKTVTADDVVAYQKLGADLDERSAETGVWKAKQGLLPDADKIKQAEIRYEKAKASKSAMAGVTAPTAKKSIDGEAYAAAKKNGGVGFADTLASDIEARTDKFRAWVTGTKSLSAPAKLGVTSSIHTTEVALDSHYGAEEARAAEQRKKAAARKAAIGTHLVGLEKEKTKTDDSISTNKTINKTASVVENIGGVAMLAMPGMQVVGTALLLWKPASKQVSSSLDVPTAEKKSQLYGDSIKRLEGEKAEAAKLEVAAGATVLDLRAKRAKLAAKMEVTASTYDSAIPASPGKARDDALVGSAKLHGDVAISWGGVGDTKKAKASLATGATKADLIEAPVPKAVAKKGLEASAYKAYERAWLATAGGAAELDANGVATVPPKVSASQLPDLAELGSYAGGLSVAADGAVKAVPVPLPPELQAAVDDAKEAKAVSAYRSVICKHLFEEYKVRIEKARAAAKKQLGEEALDVHIMSDDHIHGIAWLLGVSPLCFAVTGRLSWFDAANDSITNGDTKEGTLKIDQAADAALKDNQMWAAVTADAYAKSPTFGDATVALIVATQTGYPPALRSSAEASLTSGLGGAFGSDYKWLQRAPGDPLTPLQHGVRMLRRDPATKGWASPDPKAMSTSLSSATELPDDIGEAAGAHRYRLQWLEQNGHKWMLVQEFGALLLSVAVPMAGGGLAVGGQALEAATLATRAVTVLERAGLVVSAAERAFLLSTLRVAFGILHAGGWMQAQAFLTEAFGTVMGDNRMTKVFGAVLQMVQLGGRAHIAMGQGKVAWASQFSQFMSGFGLIGGDFLLRNFLLTRITDPKKAAAAEGFLSAVVIIAPAFQGEIHIHKNAKAQAAAAKERALSTSKVVIGDHAASQAFAKSLEHYYVNMSGEAHPTPAAVDKHFAGLRAEVEAYNAKVSDPTKRIPLAVVDSAHAVHVVEVVFADHAAKLKGEALTADRWHEVETAARKQLSAMTPTPDPAMVDVAIAQTKQAWLGARAAHAKTPPTPADLAVFDELVSTYDDSLALDAPGALAQYVFAQLGEKMELKSNALTAFVEHVTARHEARALTAKAFGKPATLSAGEITAVGTALHGEGSIDARISELEKRLQGMPPEGRDALLRQARLQMAKRELNERYQTGEAGDAALKDYAAQVKKAGLKESEQQALIDTVVEERALTEAAAEPTSEAKLVKYEASLRKQKAALGADGAHIAVEAHLALAKEALAPAAPAPPEIETGKLERDDVVTLPDGRVGTIMGFPKMSATKAMALVLPEGETDLGKAVRVEIGSLKPHKSAAASGKMAMGPVAKPQGLEAPVPNLEDSLAKLPPAQAKRLRAHIEQALKGLPEHERLDLLRKIAIPLQAVEAHAAAPHKFASPDISAERLTEVVELFVKLKLSSGEAFSHLVELYSVHDYSKLDPAMRAKLWEFDQQLGAGLKGMLADLAPANAAAGHAVAEWLLRVQSHARAALTHGGEAIPQERIVALAATIAKLPEGAAKSLGASLSLGNVSVALVPLIERFGPVLSDPARAAEAAHVLGAIALLGTADPATTMRLAILVAQRFIEGGLAPTQENLRAVLQQSTAQLLQDPSVAGNPEVEAQLHAMSPEALAKRVKLAGEVTALPSFGLVHAELASIFVAHPELADGLTPGLLQAEPGLLRPHDIDAFRTVYETLEPKQRARLVEYLASLEPTERLAALRAMNEAYLGRKPGTKPSAEELVSRAEVLLVALRNPSVRETVLVGLRESPLELRREGKLVAPPAFEPGPAPVKDFGQAAMLARHWAFLHRAELVQLLHDNPNALNALATHLAQRMAHKQGLSAKDLFHDVYLGLKEVLLAETVSLAPGVTVLVAPGYEPKQVQEHLAQLRFMVEAARKAGHSFENSPQLLFVTPPGAATFAGELFGVSAIGIAGEKIKVGKVAVNIVVAGFSGVAIEGAHLPGETMVHEFGHVLDLSGAIKVTVMKDGKPTQVTLAEWQQGRQLKGEGAVSDYAKSNALEYTAEAIRDYIYEGEKLKARDPELFAVLEKFFGKPPALPESVKAERALDAELQGFAAATSSKGKMAMAGPTKEAVAALEKNLEGKPPAAPVSPDLARHAGAASHPSPTAFEPASSTIEPGALQKKITSKVGDAAQRKIIQEVVVGESDPCRLQFLDDALSLGPKHAEAAARWLKANPGRDPASLSANEHAVLFKSAEPGLIGKVVDFFMRRTRLSTEQAGDAIRVVASLPKDEQAKVRAALDALPDDGARTAYFYALLQRRAALAKPSNSPEHVAALQDLAILGAAKGLSQRERLALSLTLVKARAVVDLGDLAALPQGEMSKRGLDRALLAAKTNADFKAIAAQTPLVSGGNVVERLPPTAGKAGLAKAQFDAVQPPGWPVPKTTAATLEGYGIVPKYRMALDGAVYDMSAPYKGDDGREYVFAVVSKDGKSHARMFWRSNSQASWRMCEGNVKVNATDQNSKGFHESDTQLPMPVSAFLHRMSGRGEAEPLKDVAPELQGKLVVQLSQGLLHGVDGNMLVAASQGKQPPHMKIAGSSYVSNQYASEVAHEASAFALVDAGPQLSLAGYPDRTVPKPSQVHLPPEGSRPDFAHPIDTYKIHNEPYKEVLGDGELTARIFLSKDGKTRYLFIEDSKGRVCLGGAEPTVGMATSFGNRATYLDLTGMDAPLIDYKKQVPAAYGGVKAPGYMDNWGYVSELPMVQYYYAAQGKPLPPTSKGPAPVHTDIAAIDAQKK